MPSSAYQGGSVTYAIPPSGDANPASGCQQAASGSVLGFDALFLLTPTRPFQGIGSAAEIAGAFTEFDGDIP